MLKYVMFGDNNFAIIPEFMGHNEMKVNMGIVSAGFCMFNPNKDGTTRVSVWGKSDSLKVESRPEDASIIQRQINKHLD